MYTYIHIYMYIYVFAGIPLAAETAPPFFLFSVFAFRGTRNRRHTSGVRAQSKGRKQSRIGCLHRRHLLFSQHSGCFEQDWSSRAVEQSSSRAGGATSATQGTTRLYMYVCIYEYTYIYIYIHVYMHTLASSAARSSPGRCWVSVDSSYLPYSTPL